jgi:hypothetical protein
MEDAADHLVHDVFPAVPVRQWVLSSPRGLRFRAARDPAVAGRLLDLFTRAVFAWQRRRGRRLGVDDPRTAGRTAVQRFGSAINLNVHFHTLIPDGVFDLSGDGRARFGPLRPPEEDAGAEDDAFAALQAAEVDRRLRFPDPFKHARCAASLDGFSLHAGVRIHANDREGLERRCLDRGWTLQAWSGAAATPCARHSRGTGSSLRCQRTDFPTSTTATLMTKPESSFTASSRNRRASR